MAAFTTAGLGIAARRAATFVVRRGIPAVNRFLQQTEIGTLLKQSATKAISAAPPKSRFFSGVDIVRRSQRAPRVARRAARGIQIGTMRAGNRAIDVATRPYLAGARRTNVAIQNIERRALEAAQGQHGRLEPRIYRTAGTILNDYRQLSATKAGRFTKAGIKAGVRELSVLKAADELQQMIERLENELETKEWSNGERKHTYQVLENLVQYINDELSTLREVASIFAINSLLKRARRLQKRLRRKSMNAPQEVSGATAHTMGKRIGERAQQYRRMYQHQRPELLGSVTGSVGAVAIQADNPLSSLVNMRRADQANIMVGMYNSIRTDRPIPTMAPGENLTDYGGRLLREEGRNVPNAAATATVRGVSTVRRVARLR